MVPMPTDNLYKFLALAGVSLLITAGTYLLQKKDELIVRAVKLQGEVIVLNVRHDKLNDEIRRFNSRAIPRQEDADKLFHKQQELDITKAELDAKRAEIVITNALGSNYESACRAAAVLGGILTVWGFWLWYLLVQRYQDAQTFLGFIQKQIPKGDTEQKET